MSKPHIWIIETIIEDLYDIMDPIGMSIDCYRSTLRTIGCYGKWQSSYVGPCKAQMGSNHLKSAMALWAATYCSVPVPGIADDHTFIPSPNTFIDSDMPQI